MKNVFTALLVCVSLWSAAQTKYAISGYVKDSANAETLLERNIVLKNAYTLLMKMKNTEE